MPPFERLQVTIPEMLSLMGLAQCVYILVYIGLHAGDRRRALLPFLYFLVLGSAFFTDFATRFIGDLSPYYAFAPWAFWFFGPALSVLLIMQIARIEQGPPYRFFTLLLLPPIAFLVSWAVVRMTGECTVMQGCAVLHDWLKVTGLIAGTGSLSCLWFIRGNLIALRAQKSGAADRYWLILMLILVNLLFLAAGLFSVASFIPAGHFTLVRTILGLGFIYLAGTSLFRIYPQALSIRTRARTAPLAPSDPDRALATRLDHLLRVEKMYQEPGFGRSEIARELGVAEAAISRVVKDHFGQSLPQILNAYRIEDAKILLTDTNAPIHVIAGEVGFNSLASFNRVFRALTGVAPGEWRQLSGARSL